MTTAPLVVPQWLIFLRGAQLFLAVIVLGISAYGVYWIAFNSWGFAIFTSLVTLIAVLYGVLTQKIAAWSVAYNAWAVIALDAASVVFWLSAMGSLAATRAIFVIPTTINGCGHDGTLGGGICFKVKRAIEKRDYVASNSYLSLMSGAAGISAIEFILFIITLVFSSIALHRLRKSTASAAGPVTNDKVESQPLENLNKQPEAQQHEVPAAQQYQQPQQYVNGEHQGPPPNANGQYPQPPQQQYTQPPPQQY